MGRRALGHLKNLGDFAMPNTARTTQEKAQGVSRTSTQSRTNKENTDSQPEPTRRSSRVKTFFEGLYRLGRKRRPRGEQEAPETDAPSQPDASSACPNDATAAINVTPGPASIPIDDDTRPASSLDVRVPEAAGMDVEELREPTAQMVPDEWEDSFMAGRRADAGSAPTRTPWPGDSGSEYSNSGVESEDHGEAPSRPGPRSQGSDSWIYRKAPNITDALKALEVIRNILKPRRDPNDPKKGFKRTTVSGWPVHQLRLIEQLLNCYTSSYSDTYNMWSDSSRRVIMADGREPTKTATQTLRTKAKHFILTHDVPENPFSRWGTSIIDDEAFRQELCEWLQSKGKYMKVYDIITFTKNPDIQQKYGISDIAFSTAHIWLNKLGYRWTRNHRGLYVDGHEREDVVKYRDKGYIPKYLVYDARTRTWSGAEMDIEEKPNLQPGERLVVFWFHDESTFYAHDRRQAQWVAEDDSPVPYAKGEGVSMMVADFVSAEYGWLQSPDGKETARRIFRAGKARDGYFTNDDIIAQAKLAMDILTKHYPNEDHVLVYDNATTHRKRPENALSALRMTKGPSENFGVDIVQRNTDGTPVTGADGKPIKVKVRMADAQFKDGSPQSLYFPSGHAREGQFKGMVTILEERGYNVTGLRAECPKFKCKLDGDDKPECCCRRILYNEPDFVEAESILEAQCRERGFSVLFLPKFHPELNFIEMCWGRAKYHYRLYPPSSKEDDLERNMLEALGKITITEMRRFARRSRRFLDAYHQGLTGKQAVWACKKYRGHRTLPQSIMDELDKD